MANALFTSAKQDMLSGSFNWPSSSSFKAALMAGYTFDATDATMADVVSGGGTIVATVALTNLTATGGVADADDVTFLSVASGSTVSNIIVYYDGGGGTSTEDVMFYIDEVPELPFSTNNGNVGINWSASGILEL